MKLLAVLLTFALALGSCRSNNDDVTIDPSANWDEQVRLSKVADTNDAENIVEVSLEAVETEVELRPGVKTKMWTYNGKFPGPTIEAKKGDTLIVNFTNKLPQETTIHWHGVEVPADMDGSHLSQHPVQPGASFRYEFKLTTASTFWYHPHVNTDEQVEKGLYGALIVRDAEEDQRLALPRKELVLVLDDILLNASGEPDPGQITAFTSSDPVTKATLALNGREGNLILVNGRNFPTINLTVGEPVRVRIINAANTRFFRLSFPDQDVYRIGGDGGLIGQSEIVTTINPVSSSGVNCAPHCGHKPSARDASSATPTTKSDPNPSKGLMLVPGERADIILTPTAVAGDYAYIDWHDFPRGRHSIEKNPDDSLKLAHGVANDGLGTAFRVARFSLTKNPDAVPYVPPTTLKTIAALTTTVDTPKLRIDLGHDLPTNSGDVAMYAALDSQGKGIPFAQLTDADALTAKVGQTYIWEVTNHTMHDHPFHPHGFSFQWLETQYVDLDDPTNVTKNRIEKATTAENKDSIRIPSRTGTVDGRSYTIVRLAVKFDDTDREGKAVGSGKEPMSMSGMSHPGGWLIHCHILEHEVGGMATYLNLSMP